MTKRVLQPESARRGVSARVCAEYAEKLSRLIACRTVWTRDGKYQAEFDRFYDIVTEMFPRIAASAERLTFGSGCFVYVIRGKNAQKNVMLMSHHDVVDGGEGWHTDPFEPVVKDGFLYGRGTIDTKTSIFAELQAVEELLAEGYSFDGLNLYIGSSNNEETSGDGMVLAAGHFRREGVRFHAVIDEGGAITEGQIPGVKCKSAVIAVHEKSRHLFRCTLENRTSGHGSLGAAKDSAVVRMSRFISEVNARKDKIYPGRFYPEVRATFERHVPYMSFPMRFLFGHIDLFSPVIRRIMMSIPAASAMLSTGLSFTTAFAGDARDPQMFAKSAEATLYLRCIREDDLYRGLETIRKIGEKHGVAIEEYGRDYCEPTDFHGEAFRTIEAVLHDNFPDVAAAPFLLTAGTDARRFTGIADSILRFAPVDLSKAQFASIHGADEHIGVENIGQCVVFYKDLIKRI